MNKILLVAVIGNIGAMSVGQFFGWASPALPKLSGDGDELPHLSTEQASWVASLLIVGSTGGAIVSKFIVNLIGRKNSMIVTTVPGIIGCLMISFATSPWELYIARFMCGLSLGGTYVASPIYLGEISPANIRGILGSFFTVSVKFGSLVAYSIGPFLSVKNFSLVCIAMPLVFMVTFIWLPESPYYLMRCGNRKKAVKALVELRGRENVSEEADTIEQAVKIDLLNDTGFREILFVPGNRRALITELGLIILQQLSGSQAFIHYAEAIFDKAQTNLQGKYLTIILGCVQTVFSGVCMLLTDYCGRRMLLMISSIGTGCSTAMAGTYFYLQQDHMNTNGLEWLPATGTILYMALYSIGLGTLPFTMLGELFPTNVKVLGGMIVMVICNVCSFIIVKWYPIVAENIGTHVTFWFFTVCSFLAVVFTYTYVPETKGKTLEWIQKELNISKKQDDS
ncbi:facilitated trehalose transporter Tret1-like [Odontomachus brunneus]|uniref:facilitated trehalose transporter Tret1-like n=1 Tax=Odontomachus brunneus TaxID=486640 RepID=UPI0013F283C8|nr:facilitated trehalose transporter Tret1-like [Odontomachus brunneus]XP_032688253.1 facilitated trehalose transporter Tret1-like [Odontomachus brunneus]